MKVRIEIDEPNGKSYTVNIHNMYYDSLRHVLVAFHCMDVSNTVEVKDSGELK